MSHNVSRGSTERKVTAVRYGAKDVQQRPLAGRWNEPGTDAFAADLEPEFQQPSDLDFERFAYRLHMDGSPEFKGHVEIVSGTTSPAVIIILPDNELDENAEPTYRVGKKQYDTTVVIDEDGSTIVPALWLYDPTTGELTLTWPYPT